MGDKAINGDVEEMEEVVIDPEKVNRVKSVFRGSLKEVPPLSSKIVRIFTSSTFTDTTVERNALMANIYPKLKEYCREKHGLEFQVVDMRWGVRDEATEDHMTTELCMQEILNCQRLSMGPNFVVFLGQKYGYRPIPTIIPAKEFEMLREVIKGVASELELLDEWYKKDDNAVPAIYVLQPISTNLPYFNMKRNPKLQERDQALWWETFGKLTKMLRKAANVLFIARKLTREQMHSYFMSVTEREIHKGILNAQDTHEHCLAYFRYINNMNTTLLKFATKFVDIAARSVDNEAQKLLTTLRETKIPAKITSDNIVRYTVDWSGKEGIDADSHADYINEFCNSFHDRIIDLVDRAVNKHAQLTNDRVYGESLQHLHMCMRYAKIFQGREEIIALIREYFEGPSQLPLILNGESGCGKTSLLAKAASMITEWYPKDCEPVMPLRFLGTSPDSSTIIPLLTSLCHQIAANYDLPRDEIPVELSHLNLYMKKVIQNATAEKPLAIFLDSMDQLSGADGAHQLAWLPIQLPPHVKIVISTLPNYYGLLDRMSVMIDEPNNPKNFIKLFPLGEKLGVQILKLWLESSNKSITQPQWEIVMDAITKCNLPLFVKLVYDFIVKWRSYSKPSTTILAYTIHDMIMQLFDRVENIHGKILVAQSLGYVTASKSGLSESELEDLLSLDEKVLNDVYQYHLPPVRRIPPLLWTRIRADLPGYFSERDADNVNVINWYHRQFIEAAKERYFRNLNYVAEIHSNIAEFFKGTWAGIPKPFEYSELQRKRFCLDDKHGESDRKMPPQPLAFTNDEGEIVRYNLRKLSEYPFHLVRSKRYDELYSDVLFNYKWLQAKLSCMPLQAVLADFEDMLQEQYDKEIDLLADALRLSSSVISHHPSNLATQITGRFLPYYSASHKIRNLMQQCDSDGLAHCALVPTYHYLHTPGGPLQYSLEGHPFAPFGIKITSDAKYIVSVSNKFIIWDLFTSEVFRMITPGIGGIMQNLLLSPDDKYAVSYTNNNQLVFCHVMTGDFKIVSDVLSGDDNIIGATYTDKEVVMWTPKEWIAYTFEGDFVSRNKISGSWPIIQFNTGPDKGSHHVVRKTGSDSDSDLTVEIQNESTEPFHFHSAIALTKDMRTMYCCIEISDDNIAVYKKDENDWRYDRTLGDNMEKVFAMTLSPDQRYLVATVTSGYKVWDTNNDREVVMKLPQGIRNIPAKNQITSLVVFTKGTEYVVAGVRKNIYVWEIMKGTLIKTLDAHFGRIIALEAVTNGMNKVISGSIDKTIKVWNFDNIMEDVHAIDRLEKPIESICLANNAYLAATVTRNTVGIWNMESGRLEKMLANSAHSSIVTHAAITDDGAHLVSAESGNILIWDVKKEKVLKLDPQRDVLQLELSDNDTKVIAISRTSGTGNARCICRSIPSGEHQYNFEFEFKKFRNGVITCDGVFLVLSIVDKKDGNALGLFHAKTGTHMNNLPVKNTEFNFMVAMPHDPNQIAIIDNEKGCIYDLKKKSITRQIQRWNGQCTANGKYGLYAPTRGGLELLELRHGKTVKVMIPKVAEGVHEVKVMFTRNDRHVLYYHTGHRTLRLFRVSDGEMIANFKCHAELNGLAGTKSGTSVVFGAVDGSLTMLTIADPMDESAIEFVQSLPSRQVPTTEVSKKDPDEEGQVEKKTNGNVSMGATLRVAAFVGKAKNQQRSRACLLQ
ncbi:unnamed protein product [Owenia fusiformis]|uniref:Uncharacterized protein n=1 Tax=Owenia fusiformis TaxID=6347 RepID=A0A8J1UGG0_OWEFU|nr:unnamed protein product [Owenia fusiformis]